ncbi:MAG: nucleotide sugar dehydrogenase [Gaiellaceae bacterium]
MEDSRTIGILGAGWVGLVTGGCFAELGHDVIVRDVVPDRIDALAAGRMPFHEPDLPDVLERNRERLRYTLDAGELAAADVLFICVQTPPTYSGDADLSFVWSALDDLPNVDRRQTLVMKSTVPVGTGEKVRAALEARGLDNVGYVSNPEFLAEGHAVRDFLNPDRIVIGAFHEVDARSVEALYGGIDAPIVRTDVASAEMIKLAANAFLMTRISFINEIANVCEAVGADVAEVARGVGLDHRLGPHFLRAGIGYGGSCLTGEETVLVRVNGRTRLVELERLYAETDDADAIEVAAWDPATRRTLFAPVAALTRREIDGEIIDLRTKMGRRIRCTVDHPWLTRDGVKLAGELTDGDWLPLAAPIVSEDEQRFDVLGAALATGLSEDEIIVRPPPLALDVIGAKGLQPTLMHPRGAVARSHDIVRCGALRLPEARAADVSLAGAKLGTCRNGTYVPATLQASEAFWRSVGLYIAEGHCTTDGSRSRLQWSFHPRDEYDLVEEVWAYWAANGVKATVGQRSTTTCVSVSSRILSAFWLDELGLGRNCYEQRIPDAIWSAPPQHKRALLAGMWRGDGSWSFVNGGPSVVLEYGTVSRRLADGLLRLLSELDIVGSLRVGRGAKSTCDTYWIRVSGADQVPALLDCVPERDRARISAALSETKRIAPTGYRRERATAWVRVTEAAPKPFSGAVYSLEVPGLHTFVTTGGLVTHNCFPKDSLALKQLASNSGYHFQLLAAVIEVNELQKRRVIQKLQKHLGRLRGKKVALLGLAFKAGTDDMREAPSIVLASRLLAEGAEVRAWDPVARPGELLKGAVLCETVLEAVTGADAAVIVTEWDELRALASPDVRDAMARALIIDGRNLLDPAETRAAGFAYEGIGRGGSPFETLPEIAEPAAPLSTNADEGRAAVVRPDAAS